TAYRLYAQWSPRLHREDSQDPQQPDASPDWRQGLQDRARASGYHTLRSETLIRDTPRILVKSLEARDFRIQDQPDTVWHLNARNLASEPSLIDEPARISLRDSAGTLSLDIELHPMENGVQPRLNFVRDNWDVAEIRAS